MAAREGCLPVAAVPRRERLSDELLVRLLHVGQYRVHMDASPLRQRDVRLIVGAVGISALGDFLLWIPLTLHLQEMSGSGLAIAGLFLALWTPVVVLAPVAGLVVDKFEARGVLLAASLAQLAVAAALVLALDSVAAILVLAALLGTGFAFAQPAEFALVPVVARGERLTEGMTAGPLLGGVLAGFGGSRSGRETASPTCSKTARSRSR
jgi:MFS family permease